MDNNVAHYPSKTFMHDVKPAITARNNFTINISSNWRKKIIEKEIDRWAISSQHIEEIIHKKDKPKYFIYSMITCTQLMTIHHLAIANGYIMSFKKNGDLRISYKYDPESVAPAR